MNVSEFARSFEMARADLKNIVEAVEDGNLDRAARLYITKAKARGLEGVQILSGMGSLLREASDLSTDEIKGLKGKVKDKLEGEEEEPEEKKPPKKKKKAKKEDDEEEEGEGEKEGDEEDDEEPDDDEDDKEEEDEEGEKKPPKKKKKVKKDEEEDEEGGKMPKMGKMGKMPPMPKGLPESTRVHRLTLRDEILKRAGLYADGQYMREEEGGTEGDASHAYGARKGKGSKKSMKVGNAGGKSGGRTEMEMSGMPKFTPKAKRRAENELNEPEDYEGLQKAMGTGDGAGAGGLEQADSLRHPAKGVGYTLGNGKGGGERADQGLAYGNSDPNVGGDGVSRRRGRKGVPSGYPDEIDNEGLASAPGTGEGAGEFGGVDERITHPNRKGYALMGKGGRGEQPSSDPNTISGMRYTGRNEEGSGSKYTIPSKGKGAPPASDPNMRNKKGWK